MSTAEEFTHARAPAADDAVPVREIRASEDVVDLDLEAEDARLREAVGKPTVVRIPGQRAVRIDHAAEWTSKAMQAAARADWDGWAAEVIRDPAEYQAFVDADLYNYQLEAVFEMCARKGNLSARKSRRPRR